MQRLWLALAGLLFCAPASAQVVYGPAAIHGGTIDGVTITNSTLADQSLNGANASGANVTATGTTTARTAADIAADVFNVKSFGAVCDGIADDKLKLQAAADALAASVRGGIYYTPSGNCVSSGQITMSVGYRQTLALKTDAIFGARFTFTNSASAGFLITINPATGAGSPANGPAVSVENVVGTTSWTGAASQTFITVDRVFDDAFQYSTSPAVTMRNVASLPGASTGGFAKMVSLINVNHSKLENTWFRPATADTTSVGVDMSCPDYTPGHGQCAVMLLDTIYQFGGGTAVTATDNFQGIYIQNLQSTSTQHAVSWTNPGGYTGADNLIITNSQMNSILGEVITNGVRHVQLGSNYFLTTTAGWVGASITGSQEHTFTGNTFTTTVGGGDATATPIALNGVITTAITGNTFTGFTGNSAAGAPIVISGASASVNASGNIMKGATVVGVDSSSTANSGNDATNNTLNAALIPNGWVGANYTINAGRSSGSSANTVDPAAINSVVSGTQNILGATALSSIVTGNLNTVSAPRGVTAGFHHVVGNNSDATFGEYGNNPFSSCIVQAFGNTGTNTGGAEQILCTWSLRTASTAQVRATASGSGTVNATNTFGLNTLGTGVVLANMKISIAMANKTTPANGGSWTLPIGQLLYNSVGPTTAWTAGTPVALGTAFTVGVAADNTTSGIDLEITPPSADVMGWTISFIATIVRGN